jgi:FkbM family methyltransferase
VLSFEIQHACIDYVNFALRANGVVDRVAVRNMPVSDKKQLLQLPSDRVTCSGVYSFSRTDMRNSLKTTETFETCKLDDVVTFPLISWLKIDVEGHDPQVVNGARGLFREKRIQVATVEMVARMWNKPFDATYATYFLDLFDYGYNAKCLRLVTRATSTILPTPPTFTRVEKEKFLVLLSETGTEECIDMAFFLPEYGKLIDSIATK